MTLNHDEDCTEVLEENPLELTFFESAPSKAKHASKGFKKNKTTIRDACDPDIIPPAANSLEEDINSEFYPAIYVPKPND